MTSPEVAYVVRRALAGRQELCIAEQITLLRGVIAVCEAGSDDAETATQALFHLQRAEAEQLHLEQLFSK